MDGGDRKNRNQRKSRMTFKEAARKTKVYNTACDAAYLFYIKERTNKVINIKIYEPMKKYAFAGFTRVY